MSTLVVQNLSLGVGGLPNGSVTTDDIANNAITTAKIAAGAVATVDIANAAVTAAKMSGAQSGSAPVYGARAWVNFNGTLTAASMIRDSGNVSSITDNGTGHYTINLTTAMEDANYCIVGTAKTSNVSSADTTIAQWHTVTASSFSLASSQGNNGVLVDPVNISAVIFT